jgi:hypothetical protein
MKINLFLIIIIGLVAAFLYHRIFSLQEKDLEYFYARLENVDGKAADVIDNRIAEDKKRAIRMLSIALVIIAWQGIWVPTNQYNFEKAESRKQFQAYVIAYENGWNDQCSAIFSRIGGIGIPAYGRGIAFTYPQCLSLKSTTAAADSFENHIGGYIRDSSIYEMTQSGRNYANRDALTRIFSMSPYWCYGVNCVSEGEFGIFRPN